jgi:aminoglycoside phosphotransferase (APT) family kinase protein
VHNPAAALLDSGNVPLPGLCAELYILPNDAEVSGARRLLAAETREEVLSRFVRKRPELVGQPLSILRYKAERRLVARLGGDDGLVIKCYSPDAFARAVAHAGAFFRTRTLHVARVRGSSASRGTLAWDWSPGESLAHHLAQPGDHGQVIERLAAALASLHLQTPEISARYQPCMVASQAALVAADVAALLPELAPVAAGLAAELTSALAAVDPAPASLHGDLSADQAILGPREKVTLIDFDRAAAGHPAYDLATFAAKLAVQAHPQAAEIGRELQRAYESVTGLDLSHAMPPFTAAAMLLLATDPFRRRFSDWPERTASILTAAGRLLTNARTAA